MNFKDKRTRRIAVASASALLVSAGGVTALSAFAVGQTLTFGPAATSATILGLNPVPATGDGTIAAGLSYGLKAVGASNTDPVFVQVLTGPASGSVLFKTIASNGAPTRAAWTSASAGGAAVQAEAAWASSDNIYLQSTAAGTYTLQLFQDHNGDGAYQSGQDDVTPAFTLNVLDVNGTTVTTSDDFVPGITAPSTVDIGRKVKPTIPAGSLSTIDTRGVSSGLGVLGTNLAAAMVVNENGAGVVNNAGAPTFTGTAFVRTPGATPNAAGTVVSTPKLNLAAPISYSTASTTVNDNLTTGLALAVGGSQTANVTGTGANVKVRPGTSSVMFTATATGAAAAKIAGATVWFTLAGTSGIALTDLTANGAAVPTTGEVSAVTDANGVATLTVTSTKKVNGNAYSVDATTNGQAGTQIVATYQTAAPSSFKVTSTSAELAPPATGAAQLKGQLLDQYAVAYQPTGADPRQVSLFLASDFATLGTANTATSTATTQMPLASDGTFSYAYTPGSAPTAGTQTAFTFAYDNDADGAYETGEAGADGTISWASAAAVATIAVSAPTSSALSPIAVARAANAPAAAIQTVTGTVIDSTTAGLAYKTVTLTGSPGVYFGSDNTGAGLVNSIQVTSNGAGTFTGYVLFTKPGAATITATSEGKSVTVNEVVADQVTADKYNVIVNNAAALPNNTVIVSGKITDAFGNPGSGLAPTLSIDNVTLGALGTAGNSNATGDWSATYIAGSVAGSAKVTATITAATLHANWLAVGGLTLPAAAPTATGTITIAPDAVAFSAPKSRLGAGNVTLTGTARAGAAVDVYRKTSSGLVLVDSVTAGNDGKWTAVERISATTTFIAKTSTATSTAVTVKVVSTVKLSVKKLKTGQARVSVAGGPSRSGTITLWITHGKKTTKVAVRVSGGSKTWVVKPGKGTTTFRATYAASGCVVSAKVGASVKL
jgi:adhesin/invasin